MKKALITGITGQDGAYLAELLLDKGYEVHGIKRRASLFNTARIDHLYQDPHQKDRNFILHYGDLTDTANLIRIIKDIEPDEIYNLGAMSHVKVSFDSPEYTANVDGLGTLRLLEAIRLLGLTKKTKIYQASTSELYGLVQETPQSETTPFYPRSPYAVAKMYAYWITVNYREAYNMYAVNGILFNHESPRRGLEFVTHKITHGVAQIKLGLSNELRLGNLEARRDWGYAGDYIHAMWLMLQQDEPDDYVIATGNTWSVQQFVEAAFSHVDLDWQQYVVQDPEFYRPAEVDLLVGDPSKAKAQLQWEPQIGFTELVHMMVDADLDALRQRESFMELATANGHQSNGVMPVLAL